MHGAADPIVCTGEGEGYKNLVAKVIGRREAEKLLGVYYIPGMGHGGAQFDNLIPAQIDALEAMIDQQQKKGKAPDLTHIGIYPREPVTGPGTSLGFYDLPNHDHDDDDD